LAAATNTTAAATWPAETNLLARSMHPIKTASSSTSTSIQSPATPIRIAMSHAVVITITARSARI
jgi:hypothetical protein